MAEPVPSPEPKSLAAITEARIVLLAGRGPSTNIVYHYLAERFTDVRVVLEDPPSRARMLAVRRRKLGFARVASQLAFMMLVRPLLKREARARVAEIIAEHRLNTGHIPPSRVTSVPSVNTDACRQAILSLRPEVVVVNGTRIISSQTLASTIAPFVNTHIGITPRYRGTHGGYWALHQGDGDHCGVTVHLVDEGIDTGQILDQAVVSPTQADNFETYPYLQLAAALPLLERAVHLALSGPLAGRRGEGPSQVWYHPGLFEYVSARLRGVR